ncbi:MAG: hypothetical protein WCS94_03450 [Verrucomicrobiota bacterium]
MKKKIIIGALLGVLLLIVIGVLVAGLFLGNIVKVGMETVGPKVTQTSLKVDSVSVAIFSGSAGVNGLVLGNPEGFKTAQAISVGKAMVSLVPSSLLSDKIIVRSIEVRSPEITFEGNPFGANNLKKIMDNVNALVAGAKTDTNAPAKTEGAKPAKKLEVDDFLISGAKVHVSLTGMGGKEMTLPLPDIHLTDLGKNDAGITPAELIKEVLSQVTEGTFKAVASSVTDLGKGAANAAKDAGKAVGEGVSKLGKSLGGLFGK